MLDILQTPSRPVVKLLILWNEYTVNSKYTDSTFDVYKIASEFILTKVCIRLPNDMEEQFLTPIIHWLDSHQTRAY